MEKREIIDLFEELVFIFKRHDVDEIGFLPTPCESNIVVVENKLGVSTALLKPLFRYAITEYKRLCAVIKENDDYICFLDKKSLLHLASVTQVMLLIRGDLPIILNTRKQLLDNKIIDYDKELLFLNALFTLHPKSPSGKFTNYLLAVFNFNYFIYNNIYLCNDCKLMRKY